MVAYEAARGGFIDGHVLIIRGVYRERRDAMLAAMDRYFPRGVRWTRPQGGLFLWATLPSGLDSSRMLWPQKAGLCITPPVNNEWRPSERC